MCIEARVCKRSKFCHHGTFLGPRWWSDPCLTAHQQKTDYMQRHIAPAPKGLVKTSGDHGIKKVVLASSWRGNLGTVSIQQTVCHACYQASQSTTGKSTWIQGWSSFMIPWRHRKHIQVGQTQVFGEMKSFTGMMPSSPEVLGFYVSFSV